ncbi:immunoglobulin-binding protein 1b [Trichogramma pretiosum]|uniref:immunoglobulin-binding protein 1b n=1 Tax=Trichogramma pretiosum TaxID=7493 RepID=UPI0006C95295|nr:immunoglobulin-binding protein 1b [Trichogramma pretiosum]
MEPKKGIDRGNHSGGEVSIEGADDTKLSDMFDKSFKLYNELNKSNEPTNSQEVQYNIKTLMKNFEDVTKLVSLADMYSGNESFEEIATENIKYLLLPALLGTLTTKVCGTEDRMHIVKVAEIYFIDFLKRLKSYGLIDIDIPDIKDNEKTEETAVALKKSNAEAIAQMVNSRNAKIQRYQMQKELEKKLEMLEKNLNNPNIDDESKREYFVTLIKIFANQALDEINSLAAEIPILEHMKNINHDPSKQAEKKNYTTSKLKPMIITRDLIQKQVYGAGYPSLPVLTVDEFYDQKIRDGEWTEQRNKIGSKSLQDVASGKVDEQLEQDKEDEEKEREIEQDDPVALARARAMDEYKDTHKRGWGNRANRS